MHKNIFFSFMEASFCMCLCAIPEKGRKVQKFLEK